MEPETGGALRRDVAEGGDPACWLSRVCRECGTFVEAALPAACPRCGTTVPADEDGGAR